MSGLSLFVVRLRLHLHFRIARSTAAVRLVSVATAIALLGAALPAHAQRWNDDSTRALVARATERRARQLADTALVDYRASAHGFLTFLAQLGEGFTEPPRIVKADEIALEVYWRAPSLSKQRIVGRRDTLLLPTDINYHRDHLGIVQNNFPGIIRLGDGDEVRDVPHPLSADGLAAYDFAISDSTQIRLPDRTIDVIEVRVRPRDDRQPRVIGAVFIDRAEGQVVRMAFNFTRAAYLDRDLEDLSIVLENGLVGARFWLPRRQEIEIRRTGRWLELPARGIIRGRWEICCYEINRGIDLSVFRGAEIVQASPALQRAHQWPSVGILDSLPPDVRAVADEDVRRVQEEARALVRADALARARTLSLTARGVSDFARVTRAEGLALGAGAARRLGAGLRVAGSGRWGFSDHQPKGEASLSWQRASGAGAWLRAYRAYRDASDDPETSTVVNSLAAQEFGTDRTEPYDVRGAALHVELARYRGLLARVELAAERQRAVSVRASPARGVFEPTLPAARLRTTRATLRVDRPTVLAWAATELSGRIEIRGALVESRVDGTRRAFGRAFAELQVERPSTAGRFVFRSTAGALTAGEVPPQDLVFLGGPTTGPGYAYHQFAGSLGASARAEWRQSVPFPSLGLGRFGRTPRAATLAPYLHTMYLARPSVLSRGTGWRPSVGTAALLFFDLLRLDIARGVRGGGWTFSIDVSRDFWSVL